MKFRVGKCGSCGATFKVPASFGGDKAKCKACGTGVVAIGPVESDEEEVEEYKPSGKKKDGPSMMEKLRAERAAAEAKPKPVPAKKPAAKKATAKPAAAKPAAKKPAAAKPAAAKKPARPVAKGAASKADEPKKAGASARPTRAGAGKSSRSSARRAGGTRARRGGDDDEEEGTGRRGRAAQKKKSPAPIIGVVVLALIASVAAFQMMGGDDAESTSAGEQDVATAGVDGSSGADTAAADGATEDTAAEDVTEAETEPEAPEATEDAPEEAPAPPKKVTESTPDSEVDPNEIDLGAFSPLEKDPECSDEEWTRIQELAILMADEWSPRDAADARDELCAIGRFAYPAMVNEFLKLDLTSEEGHREGDFFQKSMEQLLGGRNYGWKYDFDAEPNKTALFNKKVVRNYYNTASKIAGKPNAWNDLSKNPLNTGSAQEKEEEAVDLSDDDLDDLDDLDF